MSRESLLYRKENSKIAQTLQPLFFCKKQAQNEKRLAISPQIATRICLAKENAVWEISPSAEGDQRPTALDPCRLLKKGGRKLLLN